MVIPRVRRCRHCGRKILLVPMAEGWRLPVEAEMVGYTLAQLEPGEKGERLFRADGTSLVARVVPEEMAEDFAHRPHFLFCTQQTPRKAGGASPAPTTEGVEK